MIPNPLSLEHSRKSIRLRDLILRDQIISTLRLSDDKLANLHIISQQTHHKIALLKKYSPAAPYR